MYKAEWFLSMDKGDSCNVTNLTLGCHTGTHVDAPLHFLQGGKSLDEMDLDRLNGPVRLMCTRCGRLIHVENPIIKAFTKQTMDEDGFLIDESKTVFYGLCRECRETEAAVGKDEDL